VKNFSVADVVNTVHEDLVDMVHQESDIAEVLVVTIQEYSQVMEDIL
jgi:hypothetical protein